MVDWATVAASGVTSSLGVLVAVLLERRRETVRVLERIDGRLEALEARLRAVELEQVELRAGARLLKDLASQGFKYARRQGGRR